MTLWRVLLLLLVTTSFQLYGQCKLISKDVIEDVDEQLLDPVYVAELSAETEDIVDPEFVDDNLDYLGSYDDNPHEERTKKSAQTPVCIQSRCVDRIFPPTRQATNPLTVTVVTHSVQAPPGPPYLNTVPIVQPRQQQPQQNQQQQQQPQQQQQQPRANIAPPTLVPQEEERKIITQPDHTQESHPGHNHQNNNNTQQQQQRVPANQPKQKTLLNHHHQPPVNPSQNIPQSNHPQPPALPFHLQSQHPPHHPKAHFNYNPQSQMSELQPNYPSPNNNAPAPPPYRPQQTQPNDYQSSHPSSYQSPPPPPSASTASYNPPANHHQNPINSDQYPPSEPPKYPQYPTPTSGYNNGHQYSPPTALTPPNPYQPPPQQYYPLEIDKKEPYPAPPAPSSYNPSSAALNPPPTPSNQYPPPPPSQQQPPQSYPLYNEKKEQPQYYPPQTPPQSIPYPSNQYQPPPSAPQRPLNIPPTDKPSYQEPFPATYSVPPPASYSPQPLPSLPQTKPADPQYSEQYPKPPPQSNNYTPPQLNHNSRPYENNPPPPQYPSPPSSHPNAPSPTYTPEIPSRPSYPPIETPPSPTIDYSPPQTDNNHHAHASYAPTTDQSFRSPIPIVHAPHHAAPSSGGHSHHPNTPLHPNPSTHHVPTSKPPIDYNSSIREGESTSPQPSAQKKKEEEASVQLRNIEGSGDSLTDENIISSAKGPLNFFEEIKPVDTEANEKEFRVFGPELGNIDTDIWQRSLDHQPQSHQDQPGFYRSPPNQHGPPNGLYPSPFQAALPSYGAHIPSPVNNYYPVAPETQQYGNYPAPTLYQAPPPCDCGTTFNFYQSPPMQIPQMQDYALPQVLPAQQYEPYQPIPAQPQEYFPTIPTIPCSETLIFSCAPNVQEAPCNGGYYGGYDDGVLQYAGNSVYDLTPLVPFDTNSNGFAPVPPLQPNNNPREANEDQERSNQGQEIQPRDSQANEVDEQPIADEKNNEEPPQVAREQKEETKGTSSSEEDQSIAVPAIVKEVTTTTSTTTTTTDSPLRIQLHGSKPFDAQSAPIFGMGWPSIPVKSDVGAERKSNGLEILNGLKQLLNPGAKNT